MERIRIPRRTPLEKEMPNAEPTPPKPNSGRFLAGNPGGPGRPRKIDPESLEEFLEPIAIPRHTPPPPPKNPDDFWACFDHAQKQADFTLFGFWEELVFIPAKRHPLVLERFAQGKFADPAYTLADAVMDCVSLMGPKFFR